jgi:hypothetical protein
VTFNFAHEKQTSSFLPTSEGVEFSLKRLRLKELVKNNFKGLSFYSETLNLENNHITSLKMGYFHSLERREGLKLSYNLIATIEYRSFEELLSIKNIDLNYNFVAKLDKKLFFN